MEQYTTLKDNELNSISICFLSHSSGNAGAEKVFPKLLEGLSKYGIKIYVLLPSKGPVEKVLIEKNIEYKIIRYSRWINSDNKIWKRFKRTIRNILMIFPIYFQIKKWNCNIVYTNTSTIVSGAIASKLLGLPHIWHFREFGLEDYNYTYDLGSKLSQYLTNKLSTICLTNSNAVLQKYLKFIPGYKLKVLYEAYYESKSNLKESIILVKKSLNCIIIGTLHKAKGHIDAIKAIKHLVSIGMDIKLFIVGSGDEQYKNYLIEIVKSYDIENNIEFLGYLEEPVTVLKQCDILLMCSRNEAFGLVTLEAMQCGIPVIGTNSGGTKELIIDHQTGLLYSPSDILGLTEKIEYLFKNPQIKNEISLNARIFAFDNFNPDKYISNTVSVVKDVFTQY